MKCLPGLPYQALISMTRSSTAKKSASAWVLTISTSNPTTPAYASPKFQLEVHPLHFFHSFLVQGTLPEGEGSVQLTLLP